MNRPAARRGPDTRGLRYTSDFVRPDEREVLVRWLPTVRPLWEYRFSQHTPPPTGETQRRLLRPVYWLGGWQFACLGYYHPPQGIHHRTIAAEPFPEPLAGWVRRIERSVRTTFPPAFVPDGWCLNTCLVNFYGHTTDAGSSEDRARVGDHRDFEPGPVASVSVGSRAWFQFVNRAGHPVHERWLDDASLLLFAGPTWKEQTLHRVQRVDRRGEPLPPAIPGFSTRRINFTFRWVPPAHIGTVATLPQDARRDIEGYVATLAEGSPFWAAQLQRMEPK